MIGAGRRALGAAIAVAAAVALAYAAGGRGCASGDGSPEGAVQAFIDAARAGDKQAMWDRLAPATRARIAEAAILAGEKAGGARRYRPLDVLDVELGKGSYAPTDVIAREQHGDRAVVDVLGPDGRRDALTLVRVDGAWKVELDFETTR